jgi:xanthine dehydrogenase molybdopterin-binding subunit B
VRDLAKTLGIPKENVRLVYPYVGGGFGGKGTILCDAVLAALAAREAKRPVRVTLPLADTLGPLVDHFAGYDYAGRCKAVHSERRIRKLHQMVDRFLAAAD